MTTFAYRAVHPTGSSVRGVVDAPSASEAAATLARRGLLPVAVTPSRQARSVRQRASSRDLATCFAALAALCGAGVTLTSALVIAKGLSSPGIAAALERVEQRVREGSSLAAAMAAEPQAFPSVATGLLRAGERGAGLQRALEQCAQQMEQRAATVGRLRAALAYPLLLGVVGTASLAVIVIVIVPRFALMLEGSPTPLPFATRLLLEASRILRNGGWVVIPAVVAVTVAVWILARRDLLRLHERLLGLPLIGHLRHMIATARAASTLSALLGQGAPALSALAIAEETTSDAAVAERIRRARERVAQGSSFAAALTRERVLTPLATTMAAIGDQAGSLPLMLGRASEIEQNRVEAQLRTMGSMLEPAIVVAFALVVAFVAAALLQAVYSLRPS